MGQVPQGQPPQPLPQRHGARWQGGGSQAGAAADMVEESGQQAAPAGCARRAGAPTQPQGW